ncbi:restriction endonuclease [Streptomyces justiciae]|uniref:Restriction endonuclease n=1 Tax=Streptomyces justiciae TaxID=2780140 RepID=A0ABU3M8Y7_9ACTN|nr:restriction endonuclease [Streptomyces justiciae]MDT7847900.1 restriction endonuclease [Streptomyces justiciae]
MPDTPQKTVPPRPTQISSWQQAELNAARWMRHWGYTDATASPGGPDSGIDVRAGRALGQVKYQAAQVGRPELQRFVGARPHGSTAQLIFFTGSDYTATAAAYARERDIALFTYRLDGTMTPVNDTARRIHRATPSPAPATLPSRQTIATPTFWRRNWGVVVGVSLLMAPLGSIGDDGTYTGPLALDIVKFIGILLGCWTVGARLLAARFGIRLSLRTRPFQVAVVPRPRTDPAAGAVGARVPRPARDRVTAASGSSREDQVAEAARLLRSGSKPHQVDQVLKDRGVGFLDRGHILNEAKKRNRRS